QLVPAGGPEPANLLRHLHGEGRGFSEGDAAGLPIRRAGVAGGCDHCEMNDDGTTRDGGLIWFRPEHAHPLPGLWKPFLCRKNSGVARPSNYPGVHPLYSITNWGWGWSNW